MNAKLVKARAVKLSLIRCTVEIYGNPDDANSVTSEYELIVDTSDFTQMRVEGGITEMMINVPQLQEELTKQISELTLTGGVAAALNANPISWTIAIEENDAISDNTE